MNQHLRAELLLRSERDQQARQRWLGEDGNWTEVKRVDEDNTAWLTEVIAAHGWPGHALVGVDGAHAAWLLSQHATPELQARWLGLLREAVARQDAQVRDLAYLEDRVHLHQNEPQHYGTQWTGPRSDATRLWLLADRDRVNTWRADVGLESINEHDLDRAWQSSELRQLRENAPESSAAGQEVDTP